MTSNEALLGTLNPHQSAAFQILSGANAVAVVAELLSPYTEAIQLETAAGNAAQLKSALKKRNTELVTLAHGFDILALTKIQPALTAARKLAPLWHATADNADDAVKLIKHTVKALFSSASSLVLSPSDANAFFTFVVDVIVASANESLTANAPIASASPAEQRAVESFLSETVFALNTHDSKSAHSSARLHVEYDSPAAPSRFLNSSAFEALISARSSGGPLKPVTWLEQVYCTQVMIAGKTFKVYEALRNNDIRHFLVANGVTTLNDLPLATAVNRCFEGALVGCARIKIEAEDVTLNLLPSNAMLEQTARLGKRIGEKATLRVAELYRQTVLANLSEAASTFVATNYTVTDFMLPAQGKEKTDDFIKSLNKALKAAKLSDKVDRELFDRAWRQPELKRLRKWFDLVRVPIVGSQAQNCGGAYFKNAGSRGIYRFPAVPKHRVSVTSPEERSFHKANGLLSYVLKQEQAKLDVFSSLEEKYQIDNKYLPRRTRVALRQNHIERAARVYKAIVKRIAQSIPLSATQKNMLQAPRISAFQAYVLNGADTHPDMLAELANAGRVLLKAAEASAHELFVNEVITLLKEKE